MKVVPKGSGTIRSWRKYVTIEVGFEVYYAQVTPILGDRILHDVEPSVPSLAPCMLAHHHVLP